MPCYRGGNLKNGARAGGGRHLGGEARRHPPRDRQVPREHEGNPPSPLSPGPVPRPRPQSPLSPRVLHAAMHDGPGTPRSSLIFFT